MNSQRQVTELDATRRTRCIELGTKAESLERLRPLLRAGRIEDQVSFNSVDWRSRPQSVLNRICSAFGSHSLIVRSSALAEDCLNASSAGAYTSVLGVPAWDRPALGAAIEQVIASYGRRCDGDQVLVQRLLQDVAVSGVIMTRTPTLGAPYLVISFDDTTGSTETVTGGCGTSVRSLFLLRGAPFLEAIPSRLVGVVNATRELEQLVGNEALDIEFALTAAECPHILQVRPIALRGRRRVVDDIAIEHEIDRARGQIRALQRPSSMVAGETTQLSVMADWNPAEMIGTVPGRLAVSLYRHLITDEAWAEQRVAVGYRDVRPSRLLIELMGRPYIDLRVDFNSFVPADLPEALARRLVDHYLYRLERHPELHDKVEFDVVLTCLTFDFERQAERLRQSGFADHEIAQLRDSLHTITANTIRRCSHDLAAIPSLEARCRGIERQGLPPLERAFRLLEDGRKFAAPLFAHLARQGFVAAALLSSLKAVGALSDDDVEGFRASVQTVSRRMLEDAQQVSRGARDWATFVDAYGHLRPGSYDITSDCYTAAPETYLRPMVNGAAQRPPPVVEPVRWSHDTRRAVDVALCDVGLGLNCDGLLKFMACATEGRELGKFHFSRFVSAALEAIAEFGARHGVSRKTLGHIRIEELMTLRDVRAGGVRDRLLRFARLGRQAQRLAQAVCLPAYIGSEGDLSCFEQTAVEPNYVTRRKVRAPVLVLSVGVTSGLCGSMVLIPSADPGYDWLFARGIAGLITMHGGVNSHMAVRAAEFGLPAAIGVGELLFDAVSRSPMVELDCSSRQIRLPNGY